MRVLVKSLLQWILPSQCYGCETLLEEGQSGFCPTCLSKLRWIEPPFCTRCGVPFPSRVGENHLCGDCLTRKRYFTIARAIGYYEGSLREVLHRWKYEEKTYLTPFFGEKLEEGFFRYWPHQTFDLIIPVPLHPKRLKERGFNQALLLVKELSRRTRIPYAKRILQKKLPTLPQVLLNGEAREKGVRGSFHIQHPEEIKRKRILLVDDVYTTGATVNECSRLLLKAGAEQIDVLTLAHTVLHH